jgi:hypothetical protein
MASRVDATKHLKKNFNTVLLKFSQKVEEEGTLANSCLKPALPIPEPDKGT